MSNQVLRAYKYRMYPDAEQAQKLIQAFGCTRFVWNSLVANFNAWGTDAYQPTMSEKTLKDTPEFSFLKETGAVPLQQIRIDFKATTKQYFCKKRKTPIGRPNFKKKGQRQSIRLPYPKFAVDCEAQTIKFEKFGVHKIIVDRAIPKDADLRNTTISMTPSGKFFVSVLVRHHTNLLPTTGKRVGIDLGLSDLMTLSSGHKINNPRWFRENQTKLKRAQQHLSRKKRGSVRYNRQRKKVAVIHEKTANQRRHFTNLITTALVREFDVIAMEDLNVKGMSRRLNLGKSITDANLSEFTRQLEYKCNWYGKSFVQVDRFYPSTRTCSDCGHIGAKFGLEVRHWTCESCGTEHNRDLNASINILKRGFTDLIGETKIEYKSAESVDYRRGEVVSLEVHLDERTASSVKRLDELICLS